MNRVLCVIAVYVALASASYAVGPSYENKALGFRLSTFPRSENITICTKDGEDCLTFLPVGDGKTYAEEAGKCTLVMEHFRYDFADGKSDDDFMLTLAGQVIKVVEGHDVCQLKQEFPAQMRSLTGIYIS
ncbi:hypothetical protein N8D56_26545 (plasmid) [Devosia sp. A8/3-2]|nr:hypothetical protein N8D56_26545 [Devosia sp. A8/3-2]